MGFRKRTEEEKLEKFGTTKVKDYTMSEAGKGFFYANELREQYPFLRYVPLIILGVIVLLIMILL